MRLNRDTIFCILQTKSAEGLPPRYAWIVLAVVYLAGVAAPLNQFKVPPMLPVLMASLQVDLSSAGLLMAVFALTGFVLALPAGLVYQKLGPKVTGILAVGCVFAGAVTGALSTSAGSLLVSRVIEGVGMGLITVVAPAVVASWFPAEKRGIPMGIWATWVPVGSVFMYNLAPALGLGYGWQSVWWGGAAFALVALLLFGAFLRMPSGSSGDQDTANTVWIDLRQALANKQIWLLSFTFGCFTLVLLALSTFLPAFLSVERGYTLAAASFTVSLIMIVTIGSCPLAGWISDRIGSRKLIIVIPFGVIALLLILPFNVTGWLISLCMALFGISAGAIPTAIFASVPEVMRKPQLIGFGMGVVAFGQQLGMFLGPVLFGQVVEATTWTTASYLLIPVAIAGTAAALKVKMR